MYDATPPTESARLIAVLKISARLQEIAVYNICRENTLPGGCVIEYDAIGLPSRVRHNTTACDCADRLDDLLLRSLEVWQAHGAEIMQVDDKCAAAVVLELIDRWNLRETDWVTSLREYVQTREELRPKRKGPPSPEAALNKNRIAKRVRHPRDPQDFRGRIFNAPLEVGWSPVEV